MMLKERTGFTLIELLAVIVILAIIALIATPTIIGLIDNARKEAFKSSAYGILKAGETLYSKDLLNGTKEEVTFTYTDGVESSSIPGKKLDYNGTKPNNGIVKINSNGKIAIAIHNGVYCVQKGYDANEVTINLNAVGQCSIPICTVADIQTPGTFTYGDEYSCNPGDGKNRTFYVLYSNTDNVFLIMNQNIGGMVAFGSKASYLTNVTNNWTDVTVSLPTGQQLATAGGDSAWNDSYTSGNVLSSWLSSNLNCTVGTCTEIVSGDTANSGTVSGYWTSTGHGSNGSFSWALPNSGVLNNYFNSIDNMFGVRPVITVPKANVAS